MVAGRKTALAHCTPGCSRAERSKSNYLLVLSLLVTICYMGGCQSNNKATAGNNSSSSSSSNGKLQIDVFYCGGNTVKPYFEELRDYLEAQPAFKNKLSIRGHQDLMFSGRFEVFLASNSSGNAKQLIHSKKKNPGQGWARKPEERQAISDKIQEELSKREQKLN